MLEFILVLFFCGPENSQLKDIEAAKNHIEPLAGSSSTPLLTQKVDLDWPTLNQEAEATVKKLSKNIKPVLTAPKAKDGMVADLDRLIENAKDDEFVIAVIGAIHAYDYFFLSRNPYAFRYRFLPTKLSMPIGYRKYGYISGRPEKVGDHADEKREILLSTLEKHATNNPERAAMLLAEAENEKSKGIILLDTHGAIREDKPSSYLPSVEELKRRGIKKIILASEMLFSKDPPTTPAAEVERLKKLSLPYLQSVTGNERLTTKQMSGSQWPNMDQIYGAMADYEANQIQVEVRGVHQ